MCDQEFKKHIDRVKISGAHGCFVPFKFLDQFWTEERIRQCLRGSAAQSLETQPGVRGYLRVLSILVLINKVDAFENFAKASGLSDDRLPFGKPERFHEAWPLNGDDSAQFHKSQWQFCAPQIGSQIMSQTVQFDEEVVLPFTTKEPIRLGDRSQVYKIEIHPDYNFVKVPNHLNPPTYFALKTCALNSADFMNKEAETYRLLMAHGGPEESLISFYGSWKMGSTFNMLFEYADGGTLLDYFERVSPPSTYSHITQFWSGLSAVLRALQLIHAPPQLHSHAQLLQGVHQDVKPANILVCRVKGSSDYESLFKLADLGLTRIRSNASEPVFIDNFGTQMYSAPECARTGEFLQRSSIAVTGGIDIWSLGCVFSEAAVWTVLGRAGLESYATLRQRETEAFTELIAAGYSACFHNGDHVLSVVRDMHMRICREKRISDKVTDSVVNLVEEMLRSPSQDRPNAVQVYKTMQQILKNFKDYKIIASTKTASELTLERRLPPQLPPGVMLTAPKHDPHAIDNFLAHINEIEQTAVDPTRPDQLLRIVPTPELQLYLNEPTIQSILLCCEQPPTEASTIHKSYSIVLAILASIHRTPHITDFVRRYHLADAYLPLRSDNDWLDECKPFFDDFYRAQWRFCALHLGVDRLDDTKLELQRILPFTHVEPLNNGPNSRTYKVTIHPAYNGLHENEHESPALANVFVLKTCRARLVHLHDDEVHAYKTMRKELDVSANMVRFYGSWRQGDMYHMLLEYVDGGTLDRYLRETAPPTSRDDIFMFWERIFDLVKLLARIHGHEDPNDRHIILQGIHNDIKPSNILVKTNPSAISRFDVTFKLADFGSADFERSGSTLSGPRRHDVNGTQVYSAPECFKDEADHAAPHAIRPASPSKDVWSMGCVLSEAAVWSVLLQAGLDEYRQARVAATDQIRGFASTAYSGCFHDGKRALPVVFEMHDRAKTERRASDIVIADVVSLIEDMLDTADNRQSALWVYERFSRLVIRRARTVSISPTSPRETLFQSPEPYSSTHRPNRRPLSGFGYTINGPGQGGRRSVSEQYAHYGSYGSPLGSNHDQNRSDSLSRDVCAPLYTEQYPNNGTSRPVDPTTKSQAPGQYIQAPEASKHAPKSSMTHLGGSSKDKLPEASIEDYKRWIYSLKRYGPPAPPPDGHHYLHRLNGREQIFLFDDSASMRAHWEQCIQTFEVLAYLVKDKDPDGIEIRFASDTSKTMKNRNRAPLVHCLNHTTPDGLTDIAFTLGEILSRYDWTFSQKKRGLASLFSKSKKKEDMKWGLDICVFTDGAWATGDRNLEDIAESIKRLIARDVQPRQIGIQFVQFGDDPEGTRRLVILDNGLQGYGVQKDIVDTERCNGNVFKMLLGGSSRLWDNDVPKSSRASEITGQTQWTTSSSRSSTIYY